MKEARVICTASSHPTAGWVRRGFIAWPNGKNAKGDCGADAPLGNVPRYLDVAYDETATLFGLKASFFQAALPVSIKASFRCSTESGELVEFTRLFMGYRYSPELLNILARVLAGDPEMVLPQQAATKELKIHVWIDNIGIGGPHGTVQSWGRQIIHNMQGCGVTIGEQKF
ncbi:hypothetical protein LSM04_006470 [Trypanosoma melophagium]|uniref:uncharacterized protein n=1 Tax=Trypanosoma melophagium TaxID=715481 RepID=UPI00351A5ADE|nr:hypothetical protein LSM04_006470 [Trypanosoma melophagium]